MLVYYEYSFPDDDATQREIDALRYVCLLDSAACELACRLWRDALNHCHQALQLRPGSAKALYRRAVALRALDEYNSSSWLAAELRSAARDVAAVR